MYTILFLAFVFCLSCLSIFFLLVFTRKFNIYDRVDERKVHKGNIPRLGGIGIFLGFFCGVLFLFSSGNSASYIFNHVVYIVGSSTMIFIMGVWDDLKPWRARYKLLIQIIAAVCVISGGFYFRNISIGSSFVLVRLGLFAYPLTFIWIIGVTNAINLIDGIDGLAGTISLLAITAYAIFFYSYGNSSAFYICVILVISIMGFLVFNLPFPKAKIFMGDGGSQFLGFILAVLPLLQNGNALASIPITYAAAILIIPIFDTLAAIWRRIREKRRIDDPDKLHLHHKLMLLGFSSRGTLIVLVIFQLIICLLCLVSIRVSAFVAGILLLCIYLIGVLFFTIIHIKKQEELVHKAMLQ